MTTEQMSASHAAYYAAIAADDAYQAALVAAYGRDATRRRYLPHLCSEPAVLRARAVKLAADEAMHVAAMAVVGAV